MTSFSSRNIIKPSWKFARQHFWKFFLGLIILFVVSGIRSAFGTETTTPTGQAFVFSLISVILYIISLWVGLGIKKLSLNIANNKKASISDLWVTWNYFWKFVVSGFLVGVFAFLGFCLLVVPGVIIAIRLSQVPYIILDKNLMPRASLRASRAMTKGCGWKLFWFYLLLMLINILGMLCLFVGLLWTMPLTMIAGALLYKRLSGNAKGTTEHKETAPIEKKKNAAPKKKVIKKKTFTSKK